jgi:hypothetical protein
LDAGRVGDCEQLLGIRAWATVASDVLGHRKLDIQPAVRGATVPGPAYFGDCLGGVEDLFNGVTDISCPSFAVCMFRRTSV